MSIVGIVNYLQLIRFGRWFVLVAFTIGAVITPPDTTSQIVMSVPLCILYFVSIGLAYVFGKRPSTEEIDKIARGARHRRAREEGCKTKRNAAAGKAGNEKPTARPRRREEENDARAWRKARCAGW